MKGGNCRSENIIYKATVNSDSEKKFYISFVQLSTDFNMLTIKIILKVVCENETELSKYVCDLKSKYIDFRIPWKVIKGAQPIGDGNHGVFKPCLK